MRIGVDRVAREDGLKWEEGEMQQLDAGAVGRTQMQILCAAGARLEQAGNSDSSLGSRLEFGLAQARVGGGTS